MAWTLEVSDEARRQLRKIDRFQADRITRTLAEIARLENPRLRGVGMTGNHTGHWRYRVGDYRAVAKIDDGRFIIVIIAVGHRREVY